MEQTCITAANTTEVYIKVRKFTAGVGRERPCVGCLAPVVSSYSCVSLYIAKSPQTLSS